MNAFLNLATVYFWLKQDVRRVGGNIELHIFRYGDGGWHTSSVYNVTSEEKPRRGTPGSKSSFPKLAFKNRSIKPKKNEPGFFGST